MKKSIKLLSAMLMIVVAVFSLTGCGVDMSKVKGEWKVKTFDGKTPAELVTSGTFFMQNVNITDDKITVTEIDPATGKTKSTDYVIKVRSNGVEAYANKDDKTPQWAYELVDNTLKATDANKKVIIFEKGKDDIEAEFAKFNGGAEEGGEEGDEEGDEEGEEG